MGMYYDVPTPVRTAPCGKDKGGAWASGASGRRGICIADKALDVKASTALEVRSGGGVLVVGTGCGRHSLNRYLATHSAHAHYLPGSRQAAPHEAQAVVALIPGERAGHVPVPCLPGIAIHHAASSCSGGGGGLGGQPLAQRSVAQGVGRCLQPQKEARAGPASSCVRTQGLG